MKEHAGGVIAQIYRILGEEQEEVVPPYVKRWEQELGTQCNRNMVEKILSLAHHTSLDNRRTEIHYKVLARWYATPDRVSKMDGTKANTCWRGCSTVGTMAYIWWECPIIKAFWKKILSLTKDFTGREIEEDPWACLFHGTQESVKSYRSSLVPIILDEAKRQIALNWLKPSSPNTRDWLFGLNEIFNVECLDRRGMEPDEDSELTGKWSGWIKFKRSWSYLKEII